MAAACDVIYLVMLPWKPIRHHVVSLNWKYKWSSLFVPNFKSIGWIMSKVEGGGSDWTPPPSRLRVTIVSSRLPGIRLWSTLEYIILYKAYNKNELYTLLSIQGHLTIILRDRTEYYLINNRWARNVNLL